MAQHANDRHLYGGLWRSRMSGHLIPKIYEVANNRGKVIDADAIVAKTKKSMTIKCKKNDLDGSPAIILNFGRKVTGYLLFEVEDASPGAMLHIQYGPLLNLMPQTKTLEIGKGHKDWVDKSYIACKYLQITLSADESAGMDQEVFIKLRKFSLASSSYPCELKGDFECEDAMLNRIWEMGAYTVQLCMQKNSESSKNNPFLPANNIDFIANWKGRYSPYVIFDGPRRDRETWLGDIRTEALVVYSALNAGEVAKSSLEIFMDLQKPNGLTVGCGSTWQEFKEYNLWWVVSVWECFLFTGDEVFLEYLYPSIKKFLNWLEYQMDDRNFLFNDGNWMWTLPREGYSSATQCILYHALKCAAKIEKHMRNKAAAKRFIEKAAIIKTNINKEFWDDSRGIYIDHLKLVNTRIPVMSDVNSYAITFGIAEQKNIPRILDYLEKNMWTPYGSATLDYRMEHAHLDPEVKLYPLAAFIRTKPNPEKAIIEFMYPHNRMIWPFVVAYEVEARFVARDSVSAFELISRCWANMAEKEPGTFWECVDADTGEFPLRTFFPDSQMDCFNSAAHGWSGWITYILQAYVLGIKASEPGFKKTVIDPQSGPLKNIRGVMPTPYGDIAVKITIDQINYSIHVDHPAEIECMVTLRPDELKGLMPIITINKR